MLKKKLAGIYKTFHASKPAARQNFLREKAKLKHVSPQQPCRALGFSRTKTNFSRIGTTHTVSRSVKANHGCHLQLGPALCTTLDDFYHMADAVHMLDLGCIMQCLRRQAAPTPYHGHGLCRVCAANPGTRAVYRDAVTAALCCADVRLQRTLCRKRADLQTRR